MTGELTSLRHILTTAALVVFVLGRASGTARAEEPERFDMAAPDNHWSFSVGGGWQHQFEADLDADGDMDVDRFGISAELAYSPAKQQVFALALEYRHHDFDFDGDRGLAGLDPWDGVHEWTLSAPIRMRLTEKWGVMLAPQLSFAGESGADLDDGLTGGATLIFSYKFHDGLKIGPGIFVGSRLEDDTAVYPLLYLDWRINEQWRLKTGKGKGFFSAPGAILSYRATERLELTASGGWERLRFRLDDDGVARDGIGDESSFPVALGLHYRVHEKVEVSLDGGVKFGGEVELDDRDGDRLREEDLDAAGFFGLSLRIRF